MRPFERTPQRGADAVVWLACAEEVARVSGRYFADRAELRSSALAYDEAAGRRLLNLSAGLVGLPSDQG